MRDDDDNGEDGSIFDDLAEELRGWAGDQGFNRIHSNPVMSVDDYIRGGYNLGDIRGNVFVDFQDILNYMGGTGMVPWVIVLYDEEQDLYFIAIDYEPDR